MSVLTINDSKSKLNWQKPQQRAQNSNDSESTRDKNTLTFVSDFTSPADEVVKFHPSKTDTQKSEKKSRPFSYTSENWLG